MLKILFKINLELFYMRTTLNRKIAIITGASSGIGKQSAQRLEKNGYKIYNLSTSNADSETIVNINLNVVETEKLVSAINSIFMNEKRIDVFINCAGYSVASPLEKTLSTDYKYLFDVNYFAAIEAIKTVLYYMKNQNSGRIILISSVAGVLPIPFQTFYSCSKAALNMLSLELNSELSGYDIKITSLLPGGTRTSFTEKRKIYTKEQNEEYDDNVVNSSKKLKALEQGGMEPEQVAKKVLMLVNKKNPPPIATVGIKNKMFLIMQRLLPSKVILKMIKKQFAIKKQTNN